MNKTIFITGAAKRIGKEIALTFKELGWNIIIHYNSSKEAADDLAAEINNSNVDSAVTVQGNLDPQELLKEGDRVEEKTKEVLELEFTNLKEVDSAMNNTIRAQVDGMKDKISDIKEELRGVEDDLLAETKLVEDFIKDTAAEIEKESTALMDSLDRQEERNRNNVDTVRGIINAFEIRMDSKIDKLNDKLDNLEDNFDAKIKKALDNPLNN